MTKRYKQFSQQVVNEALGFVHLHYWLFKEFDESFNTHSNVVQTLFYTLKNMGVVEKVVIEVLCAFTLDVSKFTFKMMMKNNAKVALGPLSIINHLTKMWRIIVNCIVIFHTILE